MGIAHTHVGQTRRRASRRVAETHEPLRPRRSGDGYQEPNPGDPSGRLDAGPEGERARPGATDALTKKPGTRLRFWALVVAEKVVSTEKGEAMQFLILKDETALCEAVAFPDVIQHQQRPFRVGETLSIAGKTTKQDGLAVFEVATRRVDRCFNKSKPCSSGPRLKNAERVS